MKQGVRMLQAFAGKSMTYKALMPTMPFCAKAQAKKYDKKNQMKTARPCLLLVCELDSCELIAGIQVLF